MSPCNSCCWRTQASTCELQLIAGPVGDSVLWCAHVKQCPHDEVRRDVERLDAVLHALGIEYQERKERCREFVLAGCALRVA